MRDVDNGIDIDEIEEAKTVDQLDKTLRKEKQE